MNGYHRIIPHGKLHRNQPGKLKNKGTLFEKKAPKDGVVRGSNFEISCKPPQIIYHSTRNEKLSNFCEDTSWLSTMVCMVQQFEWVRPTKMTKNIQKIINFSKIYYSKRILFVPPLYSQIVKIPNFDLHLAPPA